MSPLRLIALAGAVAAVLSLPAVAEAVVYCVPNDTIDPSCTAGQGKTMIQAAFTAAQASTAVADTVRIAPGSYSEANLQYNELTATNVLTVIGAGTSQTKLTLPSTVGSQIGLHVGAPAGSSVSDLAMTIPANADTNGDTGISLFGAVQGHRLLVDGPSANNANALQMSDTTSLDHSTVNLPFSVSGNTGVAVSPGSPTIADSSIHASYGINHSGTSNTTTVVRSAIRASILGATVDSGTIDIGDSLIDLGADPGAVALDANNFNNGPAPKTINANHLTIVGGGAGSIGFRVQATAPGAAQTSSGTLTNSVISGPTTPISRHADNDGSPGTNSQANLTVGYSNYDAASDSESNGTHGTGAITVNPPGTQTNFAPGFVNPGSGNYHLAPGSALIDIGDPTAPPPGELDLDGNPRALSGTGTCAGPVAGRQDIGAYELVPGIPAGCNVTAPPPPSNAFSFVVKGMTLQVSVSAAGRVNVSDANAPLSASAAKKRRRLLLIPSSASGEPPTISVPLSLSKLGKLQLRRKGKVTVNARITFTPQGGLANTQTAKLKIKGKRKKS